MNITIGAPSGNRTRTRFFGEQDFKSCVSTYSTTRALAVREGFEPPRGDSINDICAAACGQPLSFIYLELRTHETSGRVCHSLGYFTTLQFSLTFTASCFFCFFIHSHPCQKYINRCQCPTH